MFGNSSYPGAASLTSTGGLDGRAQAMLEAMIAREQQQHGGGFMAPPGRTEFSEVRDPRALVGRGGRSAAGQKAEFRGSGQVNTFKGSKFGPTPGEFGKMQMNSRGQWGTMVDPANIPVGLQDQIMGGFYGQAGNWDTSNPSIMGPQQWNTGKYTKNASGAGSGGSLASIGPGGEQVPGANAPDERPDFYGLNSRFAAMMAAQQRGR